MIYWGNWSSSRCWRGGGANKRVASVVALALLLAVAAAPLRAGPQPGAAAIVCVPQGGDGGEEAYLRNTLDGLGFVLRLTNAPRSSDCKVYVSHPGQGPGPDAPGGLMSWVESGHGVVQIGDWGPDLIANTALAAGKSDAVEVALQTPHAITSGLGPQWPARPAGQYGEVAPAVAWATAGLDLASADGIPRGIAANRYGEGSVAFIGFNVYGPTAGLDDVELLRAAILWAAGELADDVSASSAMSLLLGSGLGALALVSRPRRRTLTG
ncbi:MAG: hypothetical protein HYV63_30940 [Candidatus Schekmanbacteria bacterium]|nr:hypothetical protein [Candidatus Schekmanbacteria bacterium]